MKKWKRFIDLSEAGKIAARDTPYVYYIKMEYNNYTGTYSKRIFQQDETTLRLTFLPGTINELRSKLNLDTVSTVRQICTELEEAAPRGRLELLKYSKDNHFFRNESGFCTYREHDGFVYMVHTYFADTAVAKIFAYNIR